MHKNKSGSCPKSVRLQRAYLEEREKQDLMEVDLNRAHIILIDQNGRLIKELHKNEH